MNIRLLLRSLPACLFILRCAAWLVPVAERAEWLAEWQAELWHVWHLYRRRSRGCFRTGFGGPHDKFSGCVRRKPFATGAPDQLTSWLA